MSRSNETAPLSLKKKNGSEEAEDIPMAWAYNNYVIISRARNIMTRESPMNGTEKMWNEMKNENCRWQPNYSLSHSLDNGCKVWWSSWSPAGNFAQELLW